MPEFRLGRRVNEFFILMGYRTELNGGYLLTFRNRLSVPAARVRNVWPPGQLGPSS